MHLAYPDQQNIVMETMEPWLPVLPGEATKADRLEHYWPARAASPRVALRDETDNVEAEWLSS